MLMFRVNIEQCQKYVKTFGDFPQSYPCKILKTERYPIDKIGNVCYNESIGLLLLHFTLCGIMEP